MLQIWPNQPTKNHQRMRFSTKDFKHPPPGIRNPHFSGTNVSLLRFFNSVENKIALNLLKPQIIHQPIRVSPSDFKHPLVLEN